MIFDENISRMWFLFSRLCEILCKTSDCLTDSGWWQVLFFSLWIFCILDFELLRDWLIGLRLVEIMAEPYSQSHHVHSSTTNSTLQSLGPYTPQFSIPSLSSHQSDLDDLILINRGQLDGYRFLDSISYPVTTCTKLWAVFRPVQCFVLRIVSVILSLNI